MSDDLWEVRPLPGGLALDLRGGDKPGLALAMIDAMSPGRWVRHLGNIRRNRIDV